MNDEICAQGLGIKRRKEKICAKEWHKIAEPTQWKNRVQILLERYAHSEIGGTSILI